MNNGLKFEAKILIFEKPKIYLVLLMSKNTLFSDIWILGAPEYFGPLNIGGCSLSCLCIKTALPPNRLKNKNDFVKRIPANFETAQTNTFKSVNQAQNVK